jgi:hypothetical protein
MGSICFSDMVGYIKKKGKNEEGLGRRRWILLDGNNGHQTRIISAYNPCKNKKVNSGTTYQQQRRYFITQKKDLTCPRTLFRRNLIKQIKSWRESGDKSYYSWITTNTLPTGHWEKSSAIGMGLT